jgi:hypothetical protein
MFVVEDGEVEGCEQPLSGLTFCKQECYIALYSTAVVFNLGHANKSCINQNEIQKPLEPALILGLKKIRPRIEVLACQKQAQSSH